MKRETMKIFPSLAAALASLLVVALVQETQGHLQQHESTSQRRRLVLDGTNAGRKEYPFFTKGSGCGASLIWKDVLLTAAHCHGMFTNRNVVVGAQRSRKTDRFSQEKLAVQEILHPEYKDKVYKDYMIVLLDSEVTNHHIETVGIAGDDMPMFEGDELTALGFGDTSTHIEGVQWSGTLQEVLLEYVSDQECESIYDYESTFDGKYMFCARSSDEDSRGDTCPGDSGGPLINQKGYQVGITSWGHGLGCGFRHLPGVYATVSSEIEWIKQSVCEHASNPPTWACEGGTSSVPPTKIPFNFLDWVQRQNWLLIATYLAGTFFLTVSVHSIWTGCRDNNLDENEKDDHDTIGEEDDTEVGGVGQRETQPDVE